VVALCLFAFLAFCIARAEAPVGRRPGRIWRRLGSLHRLIWDLTRALLLTRRPFSFVRHYLTLTLPRSRLVEFRNGTRIHLSNCPTDIATVFVVFISRCYGAIAKGSVVVDIGANIGTFAVYAARSGARVYAYEPSRGSFELLCKNLDANGLRDRTSVFMTAVTDKDGDSVAFPIESSPENSIGTDKEIEMGTCEIVPTTTLGAILAANHLDAVDCAKIDCEGAEYAIVHGSPVHVWDSIREIKMEYHRSQVPRLIDKLSNCGYSLIAHIPSTSESGYLYFQSVPRRFHPAQRPGVGESPGDGVPSGQSTQS
jgi:FkbM family methyltransferase